MKIRLFPLFSGFLLFVLTGANFAAFASNPPQPANTASDTSFSAAMTRFAESAAKVVPIFVQEFEKPFSPYLLNLAWLLAVLCFLMMFITLLMRNEGADKEFFKWLVSSVFLFCLLAYSGDINGDGKFGDAVDYFRSVGNTLAFGEINQNGSVDSGSFIQTKIDAQRTAFDQAYKDFTLKSFTVKVNRTETAVILPPTGSLEDRLFVKFSDGFNPQKVKESLKPESWDLGSLFEWLNISRGIMEIADLFLLVLNGFLGCALRLMFPLTVAVSLHKDLRAKVSTSFFWAMGVVTLVVPFFTQILRFGVYLAGNLAFQAATPTTEYFKFDPTYQTISASGNPVYLIFLMCFMMCITALLIFASPYLAFQVATGNIVNGLIGAVSGWFSGLASIGITAFTSALGGSYAYQASEQQALKSFSAQVTQADYNRQIQYEQAKGSFEAESVGVTSSYIASNTGTIGGLNSELITNRGSYENTVAGIGIDQQTQIVNLGNDAAKQIGQTQIDYNKSQAQNESNLVESNISNAPAIADLGATKFEQKTKGIPVVSSLLNTLGINGDSVRQLENNGLADSRDAEPPKLPDNFGQGQQSNGVSNPKDVSTNLPPPPPKIKMPNLLPMPGLVNPQTFNSVAVPGNNFGSNSSIFVGGKSGLNREQYQTAAILNDEMIRLGYTPQARQVLLGEFGRENSFNRKVIANGHIDDANGKVNAGIISWQGTRRDRLFNYMAKQGFVTQNGRLVDSEASLRAQVRFLDNELRTGNGAFKTTRQMLTNQRFNQKDIASRMGGKFGYIGYNNTNPKYNNAGHPVFASPNTAKWAYKASGLIAATSSNKGNFAAKSLPRRFNGSPNQVVARGGNTIQTTPPPRMNDGTLSLMKLNGMSNVEAQAYAPQERARIAFQNWSAINSYSRDASVILTKQHTENAIKTVQEAGYAKSVAAGNFYSFQNDAAFVKANSGLEANYINYQGGMQKAAIGYQTSTKTADMGFQRDVTVAQMQKDASIEAARLQAMSSIIQSVGGSVGHQLGEAFEKFNRF